MNHLDITKWATENIEDSRVAKDFIRLVEETLFDPAIDIEYQQFGTEHSFTIGFVYDGDVEDEVIINIYEERFN